MNRERLLNAVRALRESPSPCNFNMALWAYRCGTPGCVMGHYAARPDLQSEFELGMFEHELGPFILRRRESEPSAHRKPLQPWDFAEHFDITPDDASELFGSGGCDRATTPIEAAEYIERFVAAREAAP